MAARVLKGVQGLSEDLPGNGTIKRRHNGTKPPKEHRFRIKAHELQILREAVALYLETKLGAFRQNYEKEIQAYETARYISGREITQRVEARAGPSLLKIPDAYLLLYRLVYTGTGRPWISRFNTLSSHYHTRATDLIEKARARPISERYQKQAAPGVAT